MKIILVAWIVYAVAYNLALIRKAPRSKKTAPPSRDWGNQLRLLIIGATGGTGRQLVRQALEQGHESHRICAQSATFEDGACESAHCPGRRARLRIG